MKFRRTGPATRRGQCYGHSQVRLLHPPYRGTDFVRHGLPSDSAASTHLRASERIGGRTEALVVELVTLSSRRLAECVEVDALKADLGSAKCRPECLLAADTKDERLEFDDATKG